MSKFTLLAEYQIKGKTKIDIINKYGVTSSMTDLATLFGIHHSMVNFTIEGNRTARWYTRSMTDSAQTNEVVVVNYDGSIRRCELDERISGVRPVTSYSKIKRMCSNEKIIIGDILEVEYGEYPQLKDCIYKLKKKQKVIQRD